MIVNGWTIYAHPLFLGQIEALTDEVEKLERKNPSGFQNSSVAKRLAAIRKLVKGAIPQDPSRTEYRQGATLGPAYKHWFRAKFFQQYRLFFRYHEQSKIIIFVWVNDGDTKRAYESGTDAYKVFSKMLDSGNPPDNWRELLSQSREL